jgi:hypothetical protein
LCYETAPNSGQPILAPFGTGKPSLIESMSLPDISDTVKKAAAPAPSEAGTRIVWTG